MERKTYFCAVCQKEIAFTSRVKHLKSKQHLAKLDGPTETNALPRSISFAENDEVYEGDDEASDAATDEESQSEEVIAPTDTEFSLDALRNDAYQPTPPPPPKMPKPPVVKMKKTPKIQSIEIDDNVSILSQDKNLFSNKGTALFGVENRELLAKIREYRLLFPKELSKFKVKKRCSNEELKKALAEMECIVSLSGVNVFVVETILATLQGVEHMTRGRKFDISGTAMLLKANPQFHVLCKQLYLKYGSFCMVPPETQMLLLVFSTAYICINKNNGAPKLNEFLAQEYRPPAM